MSDTEDALLAKVCALEYQLESQERVIEGLEQDRYASQQELLSKAAALSAAQSNVRSTQARLDRTDRFNESERQSLLKDLTEATTAVDVLKRKLREVAEAKIEAENERMSVRVVAEREKRIYQVERRELQRRVHVAETRLKTVVQEYERANQLPAYENDTLRGTCQESPIFGSDGHSSPTGSECSRRSPGVPNIMSLADELGFGGLESDEDQDEDDGDLPELEEDTDHNCIDDAMDSTMEAWKTQFEIRKYRDASVQVGFNDRQEDEQGSTVDSVGLEIMDKLDELAWICEELGLKTVKIYRSVDWMVVLFP